ncbi:MAG: zinc-binding dehydrogenase [Saprospiraceae bacterium]
METRQAYRLTAGSRADLIAREESIAAPAADEVQVAVKAIGLNFADVFSVWGLYSATPKGAFVPGLEFAGDVIAVGSEVSSHSIGDKVYGVTRFGAYATSLNIDARYAFALPSDWSYAEGAAYPVQALTAYYGLCFLGNMQPEHRVLVHSAAGGVGVWAGRICRHFGAKAIGTVGRQEKIAFAKTQGYSEVLVRGDLKTLKDRMSAAAGELAGFSKSETNLPKGYNLVMEPTGGQVQKDSFSLLLPEGRMVVYGSAHFADTNAKPNKLKLLWKFLQRPKLDPQAMIAENKGVLAFNLIWLYEQTDKMIGFFDELNKLDLGKAHIGETFQFEQLPDAVAALQSGKTIGKVVVLT